MLLNLISGHTDARRAKSNGPHVGQVINRPRPRLACAAYFESGECLLVVVTAGRAVTG
jgi:hypothetical protein